MSYEVPIPHLDLAPILLALVVGWHALMVHVLHRKAG